MFKNLLFEFKKNDIKIKDIAFALDIPKDTLIKKLKGKRNFRISECLKLQKIIGDGNLCLEYLFKK